MKYNTLEIAFAGLMHDIGKFYQRTKSVSDLTEEEKRLTPMSVHGYNTHLHSGYTSRFFHKYLRINNEYEMLTSSHHLKELDEFSNIIRKADQIASSIDRKDEESDTEEKNEVGSFQTVRLSSIFNEVNFGKTKEAGIFELNTFSNIGFPQVDFDAKNKIESVQEYKDLFEEFVDEINKDINLEGKVDKYCFDKFYSLLFEYATLIPASTYEGNKTYVSLFDHLKLTSAIASTLALNDMNDDSFMMFEFDVSGIQKFIFKVTEGKDTKRDIAKSLRGRSFLVSAITNIITYSYLNEFGLTQSNIIFNTGGGALLLLPNCSDFKNKIIKISKMISNSLFQKFGTDLSYVYASVKCNSEELETFKTDKAIKLKALLEEEKSKKFNSILEEHFFYQNSDKNHVCKMCGTNLVSHEGESCDICKTILDISNYLVKHDNIYLVYDYQNKLDNVFYDSVKINMDFMNLYMISEDEYDKAIHQYDYIESLNISKLGNTRLIANLVPKKNGNILPFDNICKELLPLDYGDPKLGILKMDVDNLGSIFAYGMGNKRSLSKYLTLSRLMENFFGNELVSICKKISILNNPNIWKLTDNGTMFYIDYAGGDDLVIVGPAAGIIELAKAINDYFKQYTLNDNITISGGITIQSSKAPIRFGIQEAEEYLSESKLLPDKNSITLIHTTCKMNEYEKIIGKAKRYKHYIDGNKISRTNLYNMMTVMDNNNFNTYLKNIPILLYSIQRNINDEIVKKEFVQLITLNKNINDVQKAVLEMKLAIMQTREAN